MTDATFHQGIHKEKSATPARWHLPQQHNVGIGIVEQEERLVGIAVIKLNPRAESLVKIGGAEHIGQGLLVLLGQVQDQIARHVKANRQGAIENASAGHPDG